MVTLPVVPPGPLTRQLGDTHRLDRATILWRVHATTGPHMVPWDRLRHFGPTSSRFDPHPPPPGPSPRGVSYVALDPQTALAEVFQGTRVVDVHRRVPYLTAWTPTRALDLLDLTGEWPICNGASNTLTSGPKRVCRTWATAVHDTWPELDGLWTTSTMTGAPTVVLFTHAGDTFPGHPSFSRPLTTPALTPMLRAWATRIGYGLL